MNKKRKYKSKNPSSSKISTQSLMKLAEEIKYVDGWNNGENLKQMIISDSESWAGTEVNIFDASASDLYGCLPVPATGDDYWSRDGRRIFLKTIRISGSLIWPENVYTDHTRNPFVRLILIKDKRTNGATLVPENVIGVGTTAGGFVPKTKHSAINLLSNPAGWGRYEILYDEYFVPQFRNSFWDGTNARKNAYAIPFKINVKPNCYVNFSGSAGEVKDVIDNSFHLLAASSRVSNAFVLISLQARTSFVG